MPELRHLRALIAAADSATLTVAATYLGISQPTLSRTLQQFENLVGHELLIRSAHGVQLTEEGRRITELSRDILTQVDAIVAPSAIPHPLRLGFAWLLPPQWFRIFRDRASRCGVAVTPVRVDDPVAALTTSPRVDLALFRNTHREIPEGIHFRIIGTEQRCAALPADSDIAHRYLAGEPVTWNQLTAYPLVTNPNSGTTWAGSWENAPAPREIVECANFEEWIELVAAGAGVGGVPILARDRAPHPGVVYADLMDIPNSELAVAWRVDDRSTPLQDVLQSGAIDGHYPTSNP